MNLEFLHWAICNEVEIHFGESSLETLHPVPFVRLSTARATVVYPLPRDVELMEEFLPWIMYRAKAELGQAKHGLAVATEGRTDSSVPDTFPLTLAP